MSKNITKKNHRKLTFLLLGMFFIIAVAAIYFNMIAPQWKSKEIKIDGVFLTKPLTINDFHLTSNNGKPFSKANLNDHWTLMFFGFTNCGYVCPTTMAALNDMYKNLQQQIPDNQLPQVVMVSVDPDRDTIEKMNSYINSFNSHFIGARGSVLETIALEKQLHIVAMKMQADGQGSNHYSMNHSAEILLFNPKGQLQAYLSFPHEAPQMVKDYRLIIDNVRVS